MGKEISSLPNDTPIESQKYTVFSFVSPTSVKGMTECAFMFRGAFPTIDEAREHAKQLQQTNGDFNIFVGEGFKWMYFNQDIEKCVDVVYKEERLNEIMTEFRKQNEERDKIEKERQKKAVEDMEKDNKVKKLENSENPEDKIKLSIKQKLELTNKKEIEESESNIKKVDANIDKLHEMYKKLE